MHCDNTCVIAQAQKDPALSSTYVANRVRFIQNNIDIKNIFYINTKDNVCADNLSRSLSPKEFMEEEFLNHWFYGPPVSRQRNWEPQQEHYQTSLEQKDSSAHQKAKIQLKTARITDIAAQHPIKFLIENARSLNGMKRSLARILRWSANTKKEVKNKLSDPYNAEELDEAFLRIICFVQQEEFPEEYKQLKKETQISNHSAE